LSVLDKQMRLQFAPKESKANANALMRRGLAKSHLKCPNSMSGCRSEVGRLFQILTV